MLSRRVCQPWAALCLLPLLAACAALRTPDYVQTPGSRDAFALAEAVQDGARGDLPGQARTAGLVDAGVCREVGNGRLYCNALRVTETSIGTGYDLFNVNGIFGFDFEELRMCLGPDRAVGFVSVGAMSGEVSTPLYREYPEEFASMLRGTALNSDALRVEDDLSEAESALLDPRYSLTNLSVGAALRRLGYGGPGSRFRESAPGSYFAYEYPPHAPAEQACRST